MKENVQLKSRQLKSNQVRSRQLRGFEQLSRLPL
jgi:hypothetical protein